MNNDDLNSILRGLAENAKPAAKIELWPGLKKSLTTRDGRSRVDQPPVLRRAAFTVLAVLVALAIFLVSPQGQTFAQQLLKYFTTAAQRSIPPLPTLVQAPTYTLAAGLTPQSNSSANHQICGETISPISSTFVCQLQHAQAQLGFVVKSFPARYVQAPFGFMQIDPKHKVLSLTFRDKQASYSLDQGLGDFPKDSPGLAVYQEAVQSVRVGAYQAEYARGIFIFTENKGMVWNPDDSVYHLRWKENERWYSFTLSADQFSGLKPAELQAKMIQIAENLVTLDQGADPFTSGSQPSIKDSTGFTIKEPALLPEGFHQVPDGRWSNLTTNPRVGVSYEYMVNGQWVNSLTLDQMLIPADDKTLRREFALLYQNQTMVNGEWVNSNEDEKISINGVTGYYLEGKDSFTSALYWRDDEKENLLIYHWTPDFGGRLDKKALIAIADSLK